jgi:hypothetical protein
VRAARRRHGTQPAHGELVADGPWRLGPAVALGGGTALAHDPLDPIGDRLLQHCDPAPVGAVAGMRGGDHPQLLRRRRPQCVLEFELAELTHDSSGVVGRRGVDSGEGGAHTLFIGPWVAALEPAC